LRMDFPRRSYLCSSAASLILRPFASGVCASFFLTARISLSRAFWMPLSLSVSRVSSFFLSLVSSAAVSLVCPASFSSSRRFTTTWISLSRSCWEALNVSSYSSLYPATSAGSLKNMCPPLMYPFEGRSCVIAYAAVVLPHPLSPTRPIVWPSSILKLIPSTALTQLPPWILKCTFKSLTSSRAIISPLPQARVDNFIKGPAY